MKFNNPVLTVAINVSSPDFESEFNEWYNNTHVPMMKQVPGVISAKRYEAINPENNEAKYLAVYELASAMYVGSALQSPIFGEATKDLQTNWAPKMGAVSGLAKLYKGTGISEDAKPLMPVITNIEKKEKDFEYSEWYGYEHLNEMKAIEGVSDASLYHVMVSPKPEMARYLAMYEFDNLAAAQNVLQNDAFKVCAGGIKKYFDEGTASLADSLGVVYIDYANHYRKI